MGKVISLANQKGGVGKTTTSINLAASLAALEYKTLIIDSDPQANASSGIGIDLQDTKYSIYDCIINDIDPAEAVVASSIPNLFIIPSKIDLVGAEIELIGMNDRENRMLQVISNIRDDYDFVIIDCSPSLGIITVNALTASNSVIVPVQCEYFALEGLGKLLNTIKIVQGNLNPELEIEGILLTMYDMRLRLSNQVVDDVKMHFQQLVFDTIIHRNIRISEAPGFGKPVLLHDAEGRGAVNYLNLAKEILEKNNLPVNKKK